MRRHGSFVALSRPDQQQQGQQRHEHHRERLEAIESANTNRIAEAAGVSIGSLYQYFPSKEALVAAVVDRDVLSDKAGVFTDEVTRLVVGYLRGS